MRFHESIKRSLRTKRALQGSENISSLNPLSRAAKRAKTLLYVFLFAQAECERQRQALLALLSDEWKRRLFLRERLRSS